MFRNDNSPNSLNRTGIATWGGLVGFMIGKKGIEEPFGRTYSYQYNIHCTRQNFPNHGIDSFESMADKGLIITDRVVEEEMGGTVDLEKNIRMIPLDQ